MAVQQPCPWSLLPFMVLECTTPVHQKVCSPEDEAIKGRPSSTARESFSARCAQECNCRRIAENGAALGVLFLCNTFRRFAS